nr:circumsporozoite protein-like [Ziziphus jujuba var. spinosa]
MLEKAKQRNKIHQATIAMLSQMSSKKGRLLQILAGLPQNQPADDSAHWPGDVQEVWQEAGQGAGPRTGQRVGPGAEGLDWVLGQHEAIPWEGHGAGHGAGQVVGPGAGQEAGHGARHGAREGAEQDAGLGAGQGAGRGAVGLDCALGQHETNYNQMTICGDYAMRCARGLLKGWPRTRQRVGPGVEGLDWVLGQHEAIPWEGHGAGHEAGTEAGPGDVQEVGKKAGQEAGPGTGQKARPGLKDLTGCLDSLSMRRFCGRGMELDKELHKKLGRRLGMELAIELGKELGQRLGEGLGKEL